MRKNTLSHLRKYFLKSQNEVKGFIIGVFFTSFVTIAGWISGELSVFVLMMIWSILLPSIMLIFQCLGVMLARYSIASSKRIFYSGNYQDLVIKLFDDGFQIHTKVDNYYQFKSNLSCLRSHVLIVSATRDGYCILGNEWVVDALEKDFLSVDFKKNKRKQPHRH